MKEPVFLVEILRFALIHGEGKGRVDTEDIVENYSTVRETFSFIKSSYFGYKLQLCNMSL